MPATRERGGKCGGGAGARAQRAATRRTVANLHAQRAEDQVVREEGRQRQEVLLLARSRARSRSRARRAAQARRAQRQVAAAVEDGLRRLRARKSEKNGVAVS